MCDPPALVKPKPYMAMWLWLWCVGGDFQCPAGSGPQPHARTTVRTTDQRPFIWFLGKSSRIIRAMFLGFISQELPKTQIPGTS